MPDEKSKDSIENLSKKLDYGGRLPKARTGAPDFARQEYSPVGSDWSEIPEEEIAPQNKALIILGRNKLFRKILFFSAGFFALSLIVAGLVFFGGFNRVASSNIDIVVKGLIAVPGGDEIVLDVVVQNRNRVALEDTQLVIEYPSGTRDPSDLSKSLLRGKEAFGTILPGTSAEKSLSLVLFGEKGEVKDIKLSLEYRAKGSNAVFTKDINHKITISSAPLVISVKYPKEVGAREKIDFEVTVTSNSQAVVKDVLMAIQFPFGFAVEETSPDPISSGTVWRLGDLKPKEKRVVTFSGRIDAPDNEERTFRFDLGPASVDDRDRLDLAIVSSAESVVVKKPAISIDLSLNSSKDQEYAATLGETIEGTLFWANNLPVDLNKPVIEIRLVGNIFDKATVKTSGGGFYRSVDKTLVWNGSNTGELKSVHPGDRGSVTFSFELLRSAGAVSGGALDLVARMEGTRFAGDDRPEEVFSTRSTRVLIASNTRLLPQAVYNVGPFSNTGPIPPKAEVETTYTIRLPITNSLNRIGNTMVTGKLPDYVRWVGATSPSGESITWNESERTFTWNAGVIEASSVVREAAFQVAFLPSLSQVGSAPDLVQNILLTAVDSVTSKKIQINRGSLNTRLSTDPKFVIGQENVVR